MESRDDSTNAERILRNIVPVSQLVIVEQKVIFKENATVDFVFF